MPANRVPACAGIGLRAAHYREIDRDRPALGWLEAHAENYFGAGGAPLHYLETLRADYPLSLHGVGLSLGSGDPLNERHLARLAALVERFEPGLVSEHLSWSSVDGVYLNDLLPLPFTEEALAHFSERVARTQDALARQVLIENPSGYLAFDASHIPEPQFLAALAERTGCGLLLDVNNVYVSAHNLGWDARGYIDAVPAGAVGEIHLAGHAINPVEGAGEVLIDDHGAPVCEEVWALFEYTLERIGRRPVLIEWDTRIPSLSTLVAQARRADALLERDDSARVA